MSSIIRVRNCVIVCSFASRRDEPPRCKEYRAQDTPGDAAIPYGAAVPFNSIYYAEFIRIFLRNIAKHCACAFTTDSSGTTTIGAPCPGARRPNTCVAGTSTSADSGAAATKNPDFYSADVSAADAFCTPNSRACGAFISTVYGVAITANKRGRGASLACTIDCANFGSIYDYALSPSVYPVNNSANIYTPNRLSPGTGAYNSCLTAHKRKYRSRMARADSNAELYAGHAPSSCTATCNNHNYNRRNRRVPIFT